MVFQSFSFRIKAVKLFTVLAALLSLLFFFFFFFIFLGSQSSIVWISYLLLLHGTSTTVNEKLYFCKNVDSGKLFDLTIFWLIWVSVCTISTALCLFNLKQFMAISKNNICSATLKFIWKKHKTKHARFILTCVLCTFSKYWIVMNDWNAMIKWLN